MLTVQTVTSRRMRIKDNGKSKRVLACMLLRGPIAAKKARTASRSWQRGARGWEKGKELLAKEVELPARLASL